MISYQIPLNLCPVQVHCPGPHPGGCPIGEASIQEDHENIAGEPVNRPAWSLMGRLGMANNLGGLGRSVKEDGGRSKQKHNMCCNG